ncbi:MAG: alpha/beta hydrolase, partial [Mycobacterium sp.]
MTTAPEPFSTTGVGGTRIVAQRGWQAVTVDFRGHEESDWSTDGDYRLTSFAGDVQEVLRRHL